MTRPRKPPLPPLPPDGSLWLDDIARYAAEYDTLADDPTTAREFVGWLEMERAAAADQRERERRLRRVALLDRSAAAAR